MSLENNHQLISISSRIRHCLELFDTIVDRDVEPRDASRWHGTDNVSWRNVRTRMKLWVDDLRYVLAEINTAHPEALVSIAKGSIPENLQHVRRELEEVLAVLSGKRQPLEMHVEKDTPVAESDLDDSEVIDSDDDYHELVDRQISIDQTINGLTRTLKLHHKYVSICHGDRHSAEVSAETAMVYSGTASAAPMREMRSDLQTSTELGRAMLREGQTESEAVTTRTTPKSSSSSTATYQNYHESDERSLGSLHLEPSVKQRTSDPDTHASLAPTMSGPVDIADQRTGTSRGSEVSTLLSKKPTLRSSSLESYDHDSSKIWSGVASNEIDADNPSTADSGGFLGALDTFREKSHGVLTSLAASGSLASGSKAMASQREQLKYSESRKLWYYVDRDGHRRYESRTDSGNSGGYSSSSRQPLAISGDLGSATSGSSQRHRDQGSISSLDAVMARASGSERSPSQLQKSDFFKRGRLFATERQGSGDSLTSPVTAMLDVPADTEVARGLVAQGFRGTGQIYVVIAENAPGSPDHCLALAVSTYGGSGVARQGIVKADHGIIYSSLRRRERAPQPESNEEPRRGEIGMCATPLLVAMRNPSERLDPMSRINYRANYKFPKGETVRDLGTVEQDSLPWLVGQYNTVLERPREPVRGRATRSSNTAEEDQDDEEQSADFAREAQQAKDAYYRMVQGGQTSAQALYSLAATLQQSRSIPSLDEAIVAARGRLRWPPNPVPGI